MKTLTIYRDEDPKFFIPSREGFTPEVVDLEMPAFDPRDVKKLLRLPEPKRIAKWLRMGFVACDEHLSSPSVFWKEYKAIFEPLLREHSGIAGESQQEQRSTNDSQAPASTYEPLASSHKFFLTLLRAIHGVRLYGSRDDNLGQVVVRGIRARTVVLTFPSTNRNRNLRQLQWYKKQIEVSMPKSLFAQKLAADPLFMTATKKSRKEHSDGEKTESAGFPSVSIRRRDKVLDAVCCAPEHLFKGLELSECGGLTSDGGSTINAAQKAIHEMMEEAAASVEGRHNGTSETRPQALPPGPQAHPPGPQTRPPGPPGVVAKKRTAPKAPHVLEKMNAAHPVVLIYKLLATFEDKESGETKSEKKK